MLGFLKVNGQDKHLVIYASQDPSLITDIDLYITVSLLDDKGNHTIKGLKSVKLDGKEVHMLLAEVTGVWQATIPISSKSAPHKVTMLLDNGCQSEVSIEIKDTSLKDTGSISGVFPKANPGVTDYSRANNASPVQMKEGCKANYYGKGCEHIVDYAALNAVMSEIGNVVNSAGLKYNCKSLSNLTDAIWSIGDRTDHSKFVLVEGDERSAPMIEDTNYYPVKVEQRYSLNELYHSILNNTVNDRRLDPLMLSRVWFTLDSDADIYYKVQGRIRRECPVNNRIDNDGFLFIRLDGVMYLYDSETDKHNLGDYLLVNPGVVSPFCEYIDRTTESMRVKAGRHRAELYLIQFNDNLFPTDIKYKENLPRFRVDKSKPVLHFKVMRGVYNG